MPPSPSFYDDILFAWVRERSSYNYTSGQCFSDGACDPYTQVSVHFLKNTARYQCYKNYYVVS